MNKRAAIAIGSNLGDRLGNLQMARDRIRTLDGVTLPTVQSAVYETSPVDCEAGAQKFYNAVIEIGFEKSAEENPITDAMFPARSISTCCISAAKSAPRRLCNCRIRA